MVFEWTGEDDGRFGLGEDGRLYLLYDRVVGIEAHWVLAAPEVAVGGLAEAIRQMQVYRKALEPFAREFSRQRCEGREFIAIDLGMEVGSPNAEALDGACRLMGLLPDAREPG